MRDGCVASRSPIRHDNVQRVFGEALNVPLVVVASCCVADIQMDMGVAVLVFGLLQQLLVEGFLLCVSEICLLVIDHVHFDCDALLVLFAIVFALFDHSGWVDIFEGVARASALSISER